MASYTNPTDLCLLSIPFPPPFVSDMFVVLKSPSPVRSTGYNTQFSIIFRPKEFGSSLTGVVLCFLNFVICYLSIFVTKLYMEVIF